MAAITSLPNGRRLLQFNDKDGDRRSVRLGKMALKDAKLIGEKVDSIVGRQTAGLGIDRDAAVWIGELKPTLYDKFVACGLLTVRTTVPELEGFLNKTIDELKRKDATLMQLRLVRDELVKFFGATRKIDSITAGDVDSWRNHLEQTKNANSTVPRMCGRAKQLFRPAVRQKLISENPFGDMKKLSVQANESRQFFVTDYPPVFVPG